MSKREKTIICDIDGVLFHHYNQGLSGQVLNKTKVLTSTHEKFKEWDSRGYNIILITGRRESLRKITTKLLHKFGLYFDQLIMGVKGGDRILINDRKPNGRDTAWAIVTDRNEGLKEATFENLSVVAKEYFNAWSEKNLSALEHMFCETVSLKDWNIECHGKKQVLDVNKSIFTSVKKLSVDVKSLSHSGNTVFAEIVVVADGESIPVVDILKFDENSKIKCITAYRGN